MGLDPFWRSALTARRMFPLMGDSHSPKEVIHHEEEGRQEVLMAPSANEICPAGAHPARQEADRKGS